MFKESSAVAGDELPDTVVEQLDGPQDEEHALGAITAGIGLVLGVLFMVNALSLPSDKALIPLIVLPVVILCAGYLTARELMAHHRSGRPERPERRVERRRVLIASGLVALFAGLVWAVGILYALYVWIAVAIVVSIPAEDRTARAVVKGVVVGLVSATVISQLLTTGLDLRLPTGVLL